MSGRDEKQTCIKETDDNTISHFAFIQKIGQGGGRESKVIPASGRLNLIKSIACDMNHTW